VQNVVWVIASNPPFYPATLTPRSFVMYLSGILLTSILQSFLSLTLSVPCGTAPFCLAVSFLCGSSTVFESSGFWFVVSSDAGLHPDVVMRKYRELEVRGAGTGVNTNPQGGEGKVNTGSDGYMVSSRSVGR